MTPLLKVINIDINVHTADADATQLDSLPTDSVDNLETD